MSGDGVGNGERACVLVVDDDPLMRRALAREIGAAFTVLQASGVVEAIEIFELTPGIAAVVSDLAMDDLPDAGLLLLSEIHDRTPACIRILVTGSMMIDAARARSAMKVIGKPWRAGEDLATVSMLLDRK
jgi:DNA-binding NtrC family response regulator